MNYSASSYQYEGGRIIPLEDSPSYLNQREVALWILNTLLRCPKANHIKVFNENSEVVSTFDRDERNIFEWYDSTQEHHFAAQENQS